MCLVKFSKYVEPISHDILSRARPSGPYLLAVVGVFLPTHRTTCLTAQWDCWGLAGTLLVWVKWDRSYTKLLHHTALHLTSSLVAVYS